ncbi:MAG: hypothetical protein ACE5IM_09720 [Nitrospinota bacterium]
MKKSNGQEQGVSNRRGFLRGLLVGAGAVAALGLSKAKAAAQPFGKNKAAPDPILFRRTEEAERYYRTLY